MIFSLAVYGAPCSSQAPDSAYRFARAALAAGHSVKRIFFYGDGVFNATAYSCPPQDEVPLVQRWQALAAEHNIDLVVCIAAAVKRGILDENEAKRYGLSGSSLASGFALSGLGQLVDAALESDRLISFGA